MEAASGESLPTRFVRSNRVQVPQQSSSPGRAQTIAQFTDTRTQGPGKTTGQMTDNPTGGFEAERAIPGISLQRQFQVWRLKLGDYFGYGLIHLIIGQN
jgi:hypothetical protein